MVGERTIDTWHRWKEESKYESTLLLMYNVNNTNRSDYEPVKH